MKEIEARDTQKENKQRRKLFSLKMKGSLDAEDKGDHYEQLADTEKLAQAQT